MGKNDIIHANVEDNPKLGRKIRNEPINLLGRSSWTLLRDEVEAGNREEALKLLEYVRLEGKNLHDGQIDFLYANMDFVAKHFGEEEVPEMIRNAFAVMGKSSGKPRDPKRPPTLRDMVLVSAEFNRSHKGGPGELGNLELIEDDEKFEMTCDPCGSGGRCRRTGEVDGLIPRHLPPTNLGVTAKGHDWSWGKAGVQYYCAHCAVSLSIMTTESMGFPLRVVKYNEDPSQPCGFIWFKNPDNIPEEYFAEVGKVKDPSKFVRLPGHKG